MRLVGPTEIRATADRWSETDSVSLTGLGNPHIRLFLDGGGQSIGVQLIRKGQYGFAWCNLAEGPTGRRRRVLDLKDLAPVGGFAAAEDDAVFVRVRGLGQQAGCLVELEALDLIPDRVVYEDDDLRLIAHVGSSDFVLVTFSPLEMPVLEGDYWAKSFVLNAGLSAVGFVAKRPHWFMSPGMGSAVAAAREAIGSAEVVTYGSSMGAFAAIKWADRLGASSVIAMAPQSTIEPEASWFDTRYHEHFDHEIHAGMELRPTDCSGSALVFYDAGDGSDALHVDRLKSWPNVRAVEAPGHGHKVVHAFAGTEQLMALINAAREATRGDGQLPPMGFANE